MGSTPFRLLCIHYVYPRIERHTCKGVFMAGLARDSFCLRGCCIYLLLTVRPTTCKCALYQNQDHWDLIYFPMRQVTLGAATRY